MIIFGILLILAYFLINKIGSILTPFLLSFIVAYLFAPLTNLIKVNKNLSSGFIIIVVWFTIMLFFVFVIPLVYGQILALIKIMPTILQFLEAKTSHIIPLAFKNELSDFLANIDISKTINKFLLENKKDTFIKAYNSGLFIINLATNLFLTPILAFYLMRDWDAMCKTTTNIIPLSFRADFDSISKEIRIKISAFVIGQFYAILILSTLYSLFLGFSGLKFGFLIGILTGMLSIVPYIGFASCFIIAILVAFATGMSYASISVVIAIFLLMQALESNYIIPRVVGEKVGLHPFWAIFGLIALGSLLGFIGFLLAIPITAIISVLITHYVKKYKKSEFYES
jgi:predicted PurR-regulated permease PerM